MEKLMRDLLILILIVIVTAGCAGIPSGFHSQVTVGFGTPQNNNNQYQPRQENAPIIPQNNNLKLLIASQTKLLSYYLDKFRKNDINQDDLENAIGICNNVHYIQVHNFEEANMINVMSRKCGILDYLEFEKEKNSKNKTKSELEEVNNDGGW